MKKGTKNVVDVQGLTTRQNSKLGNDARRTNPKVSIACRNMSSRYENNRSKLYFIVSWLHVIISVTR